MHEKMNDENIVVPTKKNVETILEFLPYFNDSNNKLYKVVESEKNEDGTFIMGYVDYNSDLSRFIKSAYSENFVQGFDWSNWQDEAFQYVENHDLLYNADVLTIVKLITLTLRKDRFCEGFIADRIDDGFILKLLLRLKEIYDLNQF